MQWDIPREPIPETSVQQQMKTGVTIAGFHFLDFSQGRETRQTEGIPDTFVFHPEWRCSSWVEIKRPYIKGVQTQGRLSWEQERLHVLLRSSGQHVITIDEPDQVLAYFAWLNYPIDRMMYRHPWDPAVQSRFHDPKAKPRVAQPRRKSGRRWSPAQQFTMRRLLDA